MAVPSPRSRPSRAVLALACAALLSGGDAPPLLGQQPAPAPTAATVTPAAASTESKKLSPEQLDSLVAPIALYPDPLLAQTLAASTYPLEIVQLQQWLGKNKGLKDKALVDAVGKQPWDPSVQAMAAFPEVVKRLGDDIQWTADLGNAVLAQQADVMAACQRMRRKAKEKGTLESGEQMKVETKVVEKKEVIVIESANPEVIYVPSYDPVVVYGPAYYPYPSIYYPYYYPGAAWVSFGVGMMFGAMWGGWWGGCGWGGGNFNMNINNNFNRVEHYGNRGGGGRGDGNWKHNPQHRGGTPYGDRATAKQYGGTARGDSLANRQTGARQQMSRDKGMGDRASGYGNRGGAGVSDRAAGGGSRGGVSDRSAGSSRGGMGSGSFDRGGSGDRIGSRDIGGGGSRGGSGFGGGSSGGFSGSGARASSSRGASSFGGRGGGGGGRRR